MSERVDELNRKLEASRGRPGHEERIKAIEEEISRVAEEQASEGQEPSEEE